MTSRPNEGESIGLFAAIIKSIAAELKAGGRPLNDWLERLQLIRWLPPEYNGIVQIIYGWVDAKFKFDTILQELLTEETRLKQIGRDAEVYASEQVKVKTDRKPPTERKKMAFQMQQNRPFTSHM